MRGFEILIHFDVLLFVLLFVLYTLVLFKVGIVDKNRFAHPQASCVVVPQGGGLCIHRREAAALRKKKKGQYKSDARCWSRQVLLSCFVSSSAFLFSLSLSNKFGFSHFSGCWGSAGQSQNRAIRQDGVGGTLTCRRIDRGERKHVTKRELSVATLCALLGDSQSFASVEWQSVSFSVSLLAFRIVV